MAVKAVLQTPRKFLYFQTPHLCKGPGHEYLKRKTPVEPKIWKSADSFIKLTNFICTAKSNFTMINLLRLHITWHNVKRKKLHTDKVCSCRDLTYKSGYDDRRLYFLLNRPSDDRSARLSGRGRFCSHTPTCPQTICSFSLINFSKWAEHIVYKLQHTIHLCDNLCF